MCRRLILARGGSREGAPQPATAGGSRGGGGAASVGRREQGGGGVAPRLAGGSEQGRVRSAGGREQRRGRGEKREEREMVLTSGPHCHVEFTSAKPAPKTARWSKINGFHS